MNTKNNASLLGKQVKPIVKRTSYIDPETFTNGAHHYIKDPIRHRKMVSEGAKQYWNQRRKENREQEWIVWGIFNDGTYELLSDLGYTQKGLNRSDFRLVK